MELDMSPEAVTRRLETVAQLRRACLLLADSSAGRRIREKCGANEVVRRTAQAIGDGPDRSRRQDQDG